MFSSPYQAFQDHPLIRKRHNELVSAMGAAISTWSCVEEALQEIFSKATKLPIETVASLMVHIKNFSVQLNLADTAVRCDLKEAKELTYWNSIVEYIRELSGDRNLIAHGSVMETYPSKKKISVDEINLVLSLSPAHIYSDINKIDRNLSAEDINELNQDFLYVRQLLINFRDDYINCKTAQEKYYKKIERRRPPRSHRVKKTKRNSSQKGK